ncbi:MAG: ribokinase [Erysipelotrichia bacterium]|nr:ribokinase [Erysipelotrichia bacterium]
MKILVFGSLNIDHNYQMQHIVSEKETIFAHKYSLAAGGKGLNASIALSKSGVHVYLAGNIGNDAKILEDTLKEFKVDTTYLNKVNEPNGHAVIQIDENGENAIFIYGGSNQSIQRDYIDEVLNHFEKDDLLIMQNEINDEAYIMHKAKEKGLQILLNPSPFDEKILTYPLDLVDYIFINEVEGEGFTGEKEPLKILEALKKQYPHAKIILTLGSRGAYYQSHTDRIFQSAFKVKAVDTVGAGDTFMGYFCSGLSQNMSIENCLKLASKAASITCCRQGAAASIPTIEEIEQKYQD